MITNNFIQDQINFSFVQEDIFRSLAKRFINKTNLNMIHEGIYFTPYGDWERHILTLLTIKACNPYLEK